MSRIDTSVFIAVDFAAVFLSNLPLLARKRGTRPKEIAIVMMKPVTDLFRVLRFLTTSSPPATNVASVFLK